MKKQNLIGLTKEELKDIFLSLGEQAYRSKQLWNWIYYRGIKSFDEINNLSKTLKEKLNENFTINRPKIVKDLISSDKTRKWLLEFSDGKEVECVYIPEDDRGTLCISSQIGCTVGCKFCHTGTQGLTRNMTSCEIVSQLMVARDCLNEWENLSFAVGEGRKITNIVFMGMGEPLMNFENVIKALRIIEDSDGIAFSNRRITLSTSGIVPQIYELAKEIKVNLAISLHAVSDEIREKIMPINKKYKIEEIMKACQVYAEATNFRRITFEYIMIKDLNDSLDNAYKLIELVKKYKIPAKFNLIPFNPWNGCDFQPSNKNQVEKFAKILTDSNYAAPIRKARGDDIMAACGQLKSEYLKHKINS